MLRSTIHLTTCRGRRILVIYYVKKILWLSSFHSQRIPVYPENVRFLPLYAPNPPITDLVLYPRRT